MLDPPLLFGRQNKVWAFNQIINHDSIQRQCFSPSKTWMFYKHACLEGNIEMISRNIYIFYVFGRCP